MTKLQTWLEIAKNAKGDYYEQVDVGYFLEAIAVIEKLKEALEAMVNAAKDNNCGLRIADEALAIDPDSL